MAQDLKNGAEIYAAILQSFLLGMMRFWGAEAAGARLICALMAFRSKGEPEIEANEYADALGHLAKVSRSSLDSLSYITNISHLVYATTLVDTFLTDTTVFMFLMFPQAMGKNQQISLASLLAHDSRHEVITEAAARRAREIAYLPFAGRIEFLRTTFGLEVTLDDETVRALDHYPSARNTAVHDQGVFEILLDEKGQLISRQKTCRRHPTRVKDDDVRKAAEAYKAVAAAVATAVMVQVLKAGDHPALKAMLGKANDEQRADVPPGGYDA